MLLRGREFCCLGVEFVGWLAVGPASMFMHSLLRAAKLASYPSLTGHAAKLAVVREREDQPFWIPTEWINIIADMATTSDAK